jgi:hypothetical protein
VSAGNSVRPSNWYFFQTKTVLNVRVKVDCSFANAAESLKIRQRRCTCETIPTNVSFNLHSPVCTGGFWSTKKRNE